MLYKEHNSFEEYIHDYMVPDTFLITQNGKASFVLQDIESYEQTQQSIALLKILALGNQQIKRGEVITATQAIKKLRERNNDL